MELEIVHAKTGKSAAILQGLTPQSTIRDVKEKFYKQVVKYYPDRQGMKKEPNGKLLKQELTLESIGLESSAKLYFRDLGPQIPWATVYMTEYSGPLLTYLIFYARPAIIFGADAISTPRPLIVEFAAFCWTFHFVKRLLETIFIHHFSNATMPLRNIFKNTGFYSGFAGFVSYFVNHPQYVPPGFGTMGIYLGVAGFMIFELGNFSIHWHLSTLRPAGSKVRRVPYPGANPFTWMFGLVSCPHYTYETLIWLSFAAMTWSFPALCFCLVGFCQMVIWSREKHAAYLKEFKEYPSIRTAIVPFLL